MNWTAAKEVLLCCWLQYWDSQETLHPSDFSQLYVHQVVGCSYKTSQCLPCSMNFETSEDYALISVLSRELWRAFLFYWPMILLWNKGNSLSHSLVWVCETATSIVIHNLRALTSYMSWSSFYENCFRMSLVFNDFAYGKLFHPDLLPQTNISRMTSVYEILGKFFQLSELFWKGAEKNLIPSIYSHF